MNQAYDVLIIGGGPAGSTAATLLKKYAPNLKVLVIERERFPRDHVGESQLPLISLVLEEMGVWDKVEAANFPIKIGATYRWGRTQDLWDFEFVPNGAFAPEPRPGQYRGQRRQTAFQVDRGLYDQILLDHAKEMGSEVREGTSVRQVNAAGDRVQSVTLDTGEEVTARYYIDASGHRGVLRRAMEVPVDSPTTLQNIAIWDYWRSAEWATTIGVGGTRVQVLSLAYGWIWFIPLGPDRTSIGLIVPAQYYKDQKKTPEALYTEALASDALIQKLTANATRENILSSTKDWSFVAERLTGENWFLAGESAGFADPILAAGMTLAHMGARDVAYAILAMERKDYEPEWLKRYYCTTHRHQIRQHIRFADFWYSANGVFSDLKDHARVMASDAGLEMTPDDAWRWLGQGGFIDRNSSTDVGLYGLFVTKEIISSFTGEAANYAIVGKSHFVLDLDGAEKDWTAELSAGRITRRRMYRRSGKLLPVVSVMGWLVGVLKEEKTIVQISVAARQYAMENRVPNAEFSALWANVLKSLEALVSDGWVKARTDPDSLALPPIEIDFSSVIHPNHDGAAQLVHR